MTPPNVDTRVGLDLLVEDLLSAALRDVHERWERRPARVLEFDREQLMVLMERRCSGPRDAFARDLGPRAAETVPDIADVARSEEHTSELHSLIRISTDVFSMPKIQRQ